MFKFITKLIVKYYHTCTFYGKQVTSIIYITFTNYYDSLNFTKKNNYTLNKIYTFFEVQICTFNVTLKNYPHVIIYL